MAIWQVCFYVIDKNKKVDDEDIYYWKDMAVTNL